MHSSDCLTLYVVHSSDCLTLYVVHSSDCLTLYVVHSSDCLTLYVVHSSDCLTLYVVHSSDCLTLCGCSKWKDSLSSWWLLMLFYSVKKDASVMIIVEGQFKFLLASTVVLLC